jgi:Na+/H+ antiporter NhaA
MAVRVRSWQDFKCAITLKRFKNRWGVVVAVCVCCCCCGVLRAHASNVIFKKMKLASAPARYFSRWATLAASFVISVLCGLGYAFGLYSGTLQSKLGYSQRTLDLVASFGEH